MKKFFVVTLCMVVGMATGLYLSRLIVPFLPDTPPGSFKYNPAIVMDVD